jgi:hypothetical protein
MRVINITRSTKDTIALKPKYALIIRLRNQLAKRIKIYATVMATENAL